MFWAPPVWARASGLWQAKGDSARVFRVILSLLDQEGWSLDSYSARHPSGVSMRGSSWEYLDIYLSEKRVKAPAHWRWRIGKRLKQLRAEAEAAEIERRSAQFASNVIDFAKRKGAA